MQRGADIKNPDLVMAVKITGGVSPHYSVDIQGIFGRTLHHDELGAVITGVMKIVDTLMNRHDDAGFRDIEAGASFRGDVLAVKENKA